ncbi:MCM [Haloferax tailed virus 1]|uniref:MCM n=1 Tax=Haloferax tailed virus 1 TaxID=2507575 RepID=A0A410N6U8_HFTV1|nr:DNA helicase [Haloferax tailed virus 1]QAS68889.1 MCM [Haloferax tailed virus 1]
MSNQQSRHRRIGEKNRDSSTIHTTYTIHTTHYTLHTTHYMSIQQIEAWEDAYDYGGVVEAHEDEIQQLINHYPKEQTTLVIDWSVILRKDMDLADDVITSPNKHAKAFENEVTDTVPQMALVDGKDGDDNVIRGEELEVRYKNVEDPISVSDANTGAEVGNLVTIRGQISKATPPKPRVSVAAVQCRACGDITHYEQPKHGVNKPEGCRNDCNAPADPLLEESEWDTHQLLRLKHPPGESDHDTHIDVHVTKDTAGGFSGGENVDVTGVLREDFGDFDTPIPDFYLEGHAVERHQSDYEEIDVSNHLDEIKAIQSGENGDPFELLKNSIAPGITGGEIMDRIKLALGLQMFGGMRVDKADGTALRGDIHTLMVGSPGTGKSQILEAVMSLTPRVSRVSGKNVSKTGLTASAVQDDFGDTQWTIEAGAFVKANKGTCIIDELDKVDGDALSSLHSALETQRVDIAKAGIETRLQSETSLLGAANPTNERFIGPEIESYVEQIPLGDALRSRMDAVFLLKDEVDEERDGEIVEAIIDSIATGENVDTVGEWDDSVQPDLDGDLVRAWVAHERQQNRITIDLDLLKQRIKKKYVSLRQASKGSGAPINPRKVPSMIRYSIASAKVRGGEQIRDEDIERSFEIIGATLGQIGVDADGNITDDAGAAKRNKQLKTQKEKRKAILDELTDGVKTPAEIADELGLENSYVAKKLEDLAEDGDVMRPSTGEYRRID